MYNRKGGGGYYGDSSSDDEVDYQKQRTVVSRDEKLWDSFQDPPSKKKAGSSAEETERFESFVRITKFIVCFIVFILILGSSVVSKMSLLFMTSHIAEGRQIPFCNIHLPEKSFEAIIPVTQRIAWIWAIIFAFTVPELGTFLRAARICFFKRMERPTVVEFVIVFCAETLHVIGLAVLMIMVLPKLDVIQGVMLTNCLCFIPAVLNLCSDWHTDSDEPKGRILTKLKTPLNLLAVCAQLTGFVVWPLLHEDTEMWVIPGAILCISFHWWENFVSEKSQLSFIIYLNDVKKSVARTRYFTYLYISMWKIVVFLLSAIFLSKIDFTLFFTEFIDGFGNHSIPVSETIPILTDYERFPELRNITADLFDSTHFSTPSAIWWTIFIQVATSYACYVFTKFTCKIQIQSFSFGLPINLTVPISVSILLILCSFRSTDPCAFYDLLPDYLFFTPPPVQNLDEYVVNEFAWISIIWILSQTWVTRHIWTPKSDKNATTDSLFITPLYNGLLIDQSLPLNRRREDLSDVIKKKDLDLKEKMYNDGSDEEANEHSGSSVRPEDKIPQIFICATMWHENKEEMMEFLKSIIRLDEDQSARRLARNYIQTETDFIDPEYYDLETHIFFDDAFITDKKKKEDAEANPINEYVKLLITSISDAAREVYKTEMKIRDPQKFVTPYGGRLVWTLPGKTKMIAHLKHADKIRKKKRWSQVMYMYYLLGYRIMQLDIPDERKLVISKNTFLLALDGDIDFQPNAVQLLISRMKIDENLGAACGRIHPIGSGPMVWYQKFEYAIGHWLQKATEHVIGCVLCSPGCFSLFRGRALMENSVMKKYTTNSEDARHFVQYDQGEDRWLCTLLLKQRFRVEYSAASDAYTHSPEGFNEFYNQRRRWVPSTMANILDLLADAKEIVKTNDSISMPYIVYQSMLMFGTILGPGTIFLMMIGALVAVFSIDIWTSFLWNFVPLIVFMVICYHFKQKYQLIAAFGITAIYTLVMMAVLIGIIMQFMEDGLASPTSMFFFAVAGQIVIAGILHPQEIGCLLHGVIYYITIPSMYMLLVIYSLFNMNDVSWGTRETPKAAEPVKVETKGPGGKYFSSGKPEEDGSVDISLFNIFRCMLCTHSKPSEVQEQLVRVTEKLNEITNQIRDLEMKTYGNIPRKSEMGPRSSDFNRLETDSINSSHTVSINNDTNIEEEPTEKSVNTLPDWLYDPDIRNGEVRTLGQSEQKFWIEMIEKYLKPLDLSQEQLTDNKNKLKGLRDMAVFAFVMINALFVLVVFLLQLNKDQLHFKWPWGGTNEIFFDESTIEITIKHEYLELEPIGLLFVLFFGIILGIQFIAMLIHRFGTVSQILAATDLDWYCGKKAEEMSPEADMRGKAVTIAKKLQKPKAQWDEDELDEEQKHIARRRDTIKKIINQQQKRKQDYSDLERNFREAFLGVGALSLGNLKLKRKTTAMLNQRRSTIKARQSVSQPSGEVFNPASILMHNPRPSLINPGNQANYPRSYDNRSFEPDSFDAMEMDDISLNNQYGGDEITGPRHRPSHRPSHRHNVRPSVTFA